MGIVSSLVVYITMSEMSDRHFSNHFIQLRIYFLSNDTLWLVGWYGWFKFHVYEANGSIRKNLGLLLLCVDEDA